MLSIFIRVAIWGSPTGHIRHANGLPPWAPRLGINRVVDLTKGSAPQLSAQAVDVAYLGAAESSVVARVLT